MRAPSVHMVRVREKTLRCWNARRARECVCARAHAQHGSQRDRSYEETDFSYPVWLSEIWI